MIERIANYADGFMPLFCINDDSGRLEDDAIASLQEIARVARDHGRYPHAMGLEIAVYPEDKDATRVKQDIAYLESIGATHIHVRFPATALDAQIAGLREFAAIRDDYLAGRK
ncbi:hypothetical protein [Rhizorhabdus argentea]|uniref:hypothetical protein n=1 Tax=Rhizorhabdus argentea TaxID=1387174 RepID=UPI0030ECE31B